MACRSEKQTSPKPRGHIDDACVRMLCAQAALRTSALRNIDSTFTTPPMQSGPRILKRRPSVGLKESSRPPPTSILHWASAAASHGTASVRNLARRLALSLSSQQRRSPKSMGAAQRPRSLHGATTSGRDRAAPATPRPRSPLPPLRAAGGGGVVASLRIVPGTSGAARAASATSPVFLFA